MNGRYTVIVVDGSYLDAYTPGNDSVRFDGLTWNEAAELSRLAFAQDYEIVLWRDGKEMVGGQSDGKRNRTPRVV